MGLSLETFELFAEWVDFSKYKTYQLIKEDSTDVTYFFATDINTDDKIVSGILINKTKLGKVLIENIDIDEDYLSENYTSVESIERDEYINLYNTIIGTVNKYLLKI